MPSKPLAGSAAEQAGNWYARHRRLLAALLILVLMPATILLGVYVLEDRKYYFISLLLIVYAAIPFVLMFERRKPQARELIVIAVLSALAVAGRAAFFMLPQFKPVAAIVIIAGISLGAEAGFLVGATAGFVSNFFFGQGPWTPWQMFSFGLIGFVAGLLFGRRAGKRAAPSPAPVPAPASASTIEEPWRGQKGLKGLQRLRTSRGALCLFGGLATFVIYGGIINLSSLMMFTAQISWPALLAAYASGFWFDLVHASATVVFLFFLAEPMLEKLERVKIKYGLLDDKPR